MILHPDYWKFFAGIGLFLYAMTRLEDSVKELAGKKFKLFLKKYTSKKILAILNGVFATAILQSSSIVLLMVIAFAGAGIITLSNSLGIILGANLGTTLTGWIVSYIGFSIEFEIFILPLIAIGSIGLIFIDRRFYIHHYFGLLVAIGLLFLGLDYMKTSMAQIPQVFRIEDLNKFGNLVYFLFGFFVTAIIQSSSAMMTITLGALFANMITLEPAAFIVIGADLGTTITGLLASMKGSSIKKRVGFGHFLFNIGTAIFALILIKPILSLLQNYFHLNDPKFLLVAFHSSFNLIGIILFYPFLGIFEKMLNNLFIEDVHASKYIHQVDTKIPEASLLVIKKELRKFLEQISHFNAKIFGFEIDFNKDVAHKKFEDILEGNENYSHDYDEIKKVENETLKYLSGLQKEKLELAEVEELSRYILSLRNGVQAAKASKDILHNLTEFRESILPTVELMMNKIDIHYLPIIKEIHRLLNIEKVIHGWQIEELDKANNLAYDDINKWIYKINDNKAENDLHIPTFLNVNREIHTSNYLLLEAMKVYLDKTL